MTLGIYTIMVLSFKINENGSKPVHKVFEKHYIYKYMYYFITFYQVSPIYFTYQIHMELSKKGARTKQYNEEQIKNLNYGLYVGEFLYPLAFSCPVE